MLVDAPARQNASAMHTSTSSRSNSGVGSTEALRSAASIHEMEKALGSNLRDSGPFFAVSVPLKLGSQRQQSLRSHENRYDATVF
jgi:hypothetical protein